MVETKQPTFHERHDLPLEQKLVNELVNASYGALPSGSVILESFELQVRFMGDWCSYVPCILPAEGWQHLCWQPSGSVTLGVRNEAAGGKAQSSWICLL